DSLSAPRGRVGAADPRTATFRARRRSTLAGGRADFAARASTAELGAPACARPASTRTRCPPAVGYTRRMTEETTTGSPLPQVAYRLTWQAKIDELRVNEKAHTRAGDALAAERRRLPMVEVDPQTPLIGADGLVTL